jgi:hypothetical protein
LGRDVPQLSRPAQEASTFGHGRDIQPHHRVRIIDHQQQQPAAIRVRHMLQYAQPCKRQLVPEGVTTQLPKVSCLIPAIRHNSIWVTNNKRPKGFVALTQMSQSPTLRYGWYNVQQVASNACYFCSEISLGPRAAILSGPVTVTCAFEALGWKTKEYGKEKQGMA